jgi:hypothetical protein
VSARTPDPYAILGVRRDASREQIARAYRSRAKRAHPDVSGEPSSQMQELNWAWNVLSDGRRRAEWDRDHGTPSSHRHWAEPDQSVRAAPGTWQGRYANPAWTVSGEPWAGAGAPAVEQRASIGCLGVGLLVVMLSAFVLLGGFLSGYQSPGGEPVEASETNPGS